MLFNVTLCRKKWQVDFGRLSYSNTLDDFFPFHLQKTMTWMFWIKTDRRPRKYKAFLTGYWFIWHKCQRACTIKNCLSVIIMVCGQSFWPQAWTQQLDICTYAPGICRWNIQYICPDVFVFIITASSRYMLDHWAIISYAGVHWY